MEIEKFIKDKRESSTQVQSYTVYELSKFFPGRLDSFEEVVSFFRKIFNGINYQLGHVKILSHLYYGETFEEQLEDEDVELFFNDGIVIHPVYGEEVEDLEQSLSFILHIHQNDDL